jgi:hypothetical protein
MNIVLNADRYNFIKSTNENISVMPTNHLKSGVQPTPETSFVSNICETMGNALQNSGIA